MAPPNSRKPGKNNASNELVVSDARFDRVHTDPRFQRIPRGKSKVPIDSRFNTMFTDKNFAPEFSVDKRGRKVSKKSGENLAKYYKLEPDGDHEGIKKELKGKSEPLKSPKKGSKQDKEKVFIRNKNHFNEQLKVLKQVEDEDDGFLENEEDSGDFEEDDSLEELPESELKPDDQSERFAKSRGLESSNDSTSSSSSDDDDSEEEIEDDENIIEEEVALTDDVSHRLAVVNLDWDHVRAVDLLVLFRSFAPKGGSVNSVSIYPSDFGLEQLKEESEKGPVALLKNLEPEVDSAEEEENEEEVQKRLRSYERSRLRYFYAVVECDSKRTANAIYEQCDGTEYERSSNVIDLRFIPDSMKIGEDREAKDVCTDVIADYKGLDFTTRALQHSRVKLTWDDDEPTRVKTLRRKFTEEEIQEMNFKDYLASSSEDESEEEVGEKNQEVKDDAEENGLSKEEKRRKMREKYRKLLLGEGSDEKVENGEEDEENKGKNDEEMEVTFTTGLGGLSEKLEKNQKEKELKAKETVFEANLRKKKEKKREKKKMEQGKGGPLEGSEDDGLYGETEEADPFFSVEDDVFNDPFFQSVGGTVKEGSESLNGREMKNKQKSTLGDIKNKKNQEKEREKLETERQKAELEMLLMEENDDGLGLRRSGDLNGLNGEELLKGDKKKKGKNKNKKMTGSKEDEKEDEEMGIPANYEDPRFSKLFESPLFALDPTDPQFTRSKAQLATLAEKQRNKMQGGLNSRNRVVEQVDRKKEENGKQKAELSFLVNSLKRKAQTKKKPSGIQELQASKKKVRQ